MRLAATKDEFSEALVVSNEDSSLAHSEDQDTRIISLRYCLSNGKHVVPNAPQIFGYCCTGRLVYDELHGCLSESFTYSI